MAVRTIHIAAPDDLRTIFAALREVLAARLAPDEVRWDEAATPQGSLLDGGSNDGAGARPGHPESLEADRGARASAGLVLPRPLVELLSTALLHTSPERFHTAHALMAAVLRDRRAWNDTLREDRLRLERMSREVRREIHKMHAFVRFRPIHDEAGECHVAWFEPAMHVLRAAAPHFVERFAAMRWAILTPRGSVHWDRRELSFGAPALRAEAPLPDAGESLWLAYYRSVFNPARLKPAMMRREMPIRFWPNLPEAVQIAGLMQQAGSRAHGMQARVSPDRARRAGVAGHLAGHACAAHGHAHPADADPALQTASPLHQMAMLARQASACDACPFAADATQTVWGEGRPGAAIMLVGEQPGDQEDLAGRPFVGPAGQLLHRAIAALQWPVDQLYLTNAVKHFKYVWRGKRRIHKTAAQREAQACSHWLEQEIATVRPRAIVALGRTALASLLQEEAGVDAHAGQWLRRAKDGLWVYVMPHPAAVLRAAGNDLAHLEAGWTALLANAGQALRQQNPEPPVFSPAP